MPSEVCEFHAAQPVVRHQALQHARKRPDVDRLVVPDVAPRRPRLGHRVVVDVDLARDAKVGELRVEAVVEQDVLGLEVAVDDRRRQAVEVVEAARDADRGSFTGQPMKWYCSSSRSWQLEDADVRRAVAPRAAERGGASISSASALNDASIRPVIMCRRLLHRHRRAVERRRVHLAERAAPRRFPISSSCPPPRAAHHVGHRASSASSAAFSSAVAFSRSHLRHLRLGALLVLEELRARARLADRLRRVGGEVLDQGGVAQSLTCRGRSRAAVGDSVVVELEGLLQLGRQHPPLSSSVLSTNDQKKTPHRQKDEPSAMKSWISKRYGCEIPTSSMKASETSIRSRVATPWAG